VGPLLQINMDMAESIPLAVANPGRADQDRAAVANARAGSSSLTEMESDPGSSGRAPDVVLIKLQSFRWVARRRPRFAVCGWPTSSNRPIQTQQDLDEALGHYVTRSRSSSTKVLRSFWSDPC